ncbi:MAG: hypothetical protein GY887_16240 [Halieaceae bacterium]|nr:hypothetical protein [Halieaceae bacterium]
MVSSLFRVLAAFFAAFSINAHPAPSFEPIDPTKMVLKNTRALDDDSEYQVYTHPVGAPGSNKYVRPDAPPDSPFKTALIVPRDPPDDASLRVSVYFDGFTTNPERFPTADFGSPGYAVIKTHHGHYPNLKAYAGKSGVKPYDWGGFAKGDSNGWRFGAGFVKLSEIMPGSIDWGGGLRLEGKSWGGTTAILQSLLIKGPAVQSAVTIVNSNIPNTLFVRKDTTPGDNIDQNGMYYMDPSAVQYAWDDPTDVITGDIIANADKLKGVYYAVFGNSQDQVTKFDLEFFTLFCEAKKIACMGAWRGGDHNFPDTGLVESRNRKSSVGLPAFMSSPYGPSGPFSGPDSDSRLDKILPVFTNSTANFFSSTPGKPGFVRGHYNLGLEWNSSTQLTPTEDKLSLPIRYRKHTGFGTGSRYAWGEERGPDKNKANWIPDQPDSVSFDLTLRRTGSFSLPLGKEVCYLLPAQGGNPKQSGVAIVTVADEVTVTALTLDTSNTYSDFELTPKTSSCTE